VTLDGKVVGATPLDISLSYQYASRGASVDESMQHRVRVEKNGYESYALSFSVSGKEFQRIPNPIKLKQKLAETVSITGAAGALKRITTGGPAKKVLDLSPDRQWLLIQAKEVGPGAADGSVLQKINLLNGTRVALSPRSSDNKEAMWLPDMSGFIFISDRLGTYTLAQSLGVSGEVGARFITQPALGAIRYPAVSPKGHEIAFTVINQSSNILSIADNDGTNLRMYGPGRQPDWAPSGNTIAFARQAGGSSHIFTMNPEKGTDLVQLTVSGASDRLPKWSPNGKHMAFISDRVQGNRHLFVMNNRGGAITQLTEGNFNLSSVCWGEDGYIYFSANAGGNWDVWRLKPSF